MSGSDGRMLDIARKLIFPRWRAEFLNFVETGNASAEFRQYLDSNQDAKQGIEEAFSIKYQSIDALALALGTSTNPTERS